MQEYNDPAVVAEMKARYDRPENRIERDGRPICRHCGLDWGSYVHGC